MPGSLGVEAAAQLLRAFGRWWDPGFALAFAAPAGEAAAPVQAWKYRGQIAPPRGGSPPGGGGAQDRGAWSVVVHVAEVCENVSREGGGSSLVLVGDAEVWRGRVGDGVRIYEINGLSVRLDRGEKDSYG
jgi:hypothetical protein